MVKRLLRLFIVIFAGLTLVYMGVLGWMQYQSTSDARLARARLCAGLGAQVLEHSLFDSEDGAASVRTAMGENNLKNIRGWPEAERIMKSLEVQGSFNCVYVVNVYGEPLGTNCGAHIDGVMRILRVNKETGIDEIELHGESFYLARKPILLGGETVGAICVLMDTFDGFKPGLIKMVTPVLFWLVISTVLILVVRYKMKRTLQPLNDLIEVTDQLSEGVLGARCNAYTRSDEVGMLARSFNGLAATLEITFNSLERQVQQRTASLNKLIEKAPAAIILVDLSSWNTVRFNQTAVRMLGMDEDELVGRNMTELIPFVTKKLFTDARDEHAATVEGRLDLGDVKGLPLYVSATRIMMDDREQGLLMCTDVTRIVKVREALAYSERRYRELIDHLNMMLVVCSFDGEIHMINKVGCNLLGLTEEQAVHSNWDDLPIELIDPEDRQSTGAELLYRIRAGSIDWATNSVLGIPGEGKSDIRWILFNKFTIRGEDGVSTQIVINGFDVTNLQQAQEAYRSISDKRRQLAEIIDRSQMVAFLWRAVKSLPVEYVSDNVGVLGYSAADFYSGRISFLDLVHPEDQGLLEQYIMLVSGNAKDTMSSVRCRLMLPSGTLRWVEIRLIQGADGGHARHLQGLVLDITEQKAMEDEINRINTVVRDSSDATIIASVDGRVQYTNKAFYDMFGSDHKDMNGKALTDLFADEKEAHDLVNIVSNGFNWMGEMDVIAEGGHRVPVYLRGVAILDKRHTVTDIAFMMADVSVQKKAEKEQQMIEVQFRHAQKMESIGQLAAGIAHEINTPSQFVGDNLQFLQDGFKDLIGLIEHFHAMVPKLPEPEQEIITEQEAEADMEYLSEEIPRAVSQSLEGITRITHIVRAMKEFSHPGKGEWQTVDINHSIENTIAVARNEWKYVADIEQDFAPGLPLISCSEGEINQVILNIIINAVHAIKGTVDESREKGVIRIRTMQEGGYVVIRISDTGTGIPEGIRDRIFDPFFTTKEVGLGTGQGLAISYDVIVNKHQGELSFETEEGKGTEFIIQLPVGDRGHKPE
ncbi:MAG: PAS domain S-box protein [Spartobacteria bacterium]|nr:PAS domain S-box protein [Spartobacteria bacterium]